MLPGALEAATAMLSHYVRSEERLHTLGYLALRGVVSRSACGGAARALFGVVLPQHAVMQNDRHVLPVAWSAIILQDGSAFQVKLL